MKHLGIAALGIVGALAFARDKCVCGHCLQ